MATSARHEARARAKPLGADAYETFLAVAAIVLLATVLVALAKGHAAWAHIPLPVWAHLGTIFVALALTPVMLLRRRGDPPHRLLGKVWVAAMFLTAALSFLVRNANHGGLSVIHLLSAYVLFAAPHLWWAARTHRVAAHRRSVRAMVTGALLIAGFFTLPFGRMLGTMLFS